MPTTNNLKQVKLNVMTEAQFEEMTQNENEFYAVTDAELSYDDLADKPDLSIYLTSSDIVSSVDSSSTNSEAVGAKLFYDTCGNIETLINAL